MDSDVLALPDFSPGYVPRFTRASLNHSRLSQPCRLSKSIPSWLRARSVVVSCLAVLTIPRLGNSPFECPLECHDLRVQPRQLKVSIQRMHWAVFRLDFYSRLEFFRTQCSCLVSLPMGGVGENDRAMLFQLICLTGRQWLRKERPGNAISADLPKSVYKCAVLST